MVPYPSGGRARNTPSRTVAPVARAFRREKGRVVGRLEPYEVDLVRGLVGDVVRLVGEDGDDPVRARLFPDPSPDPEVAAQLRDLIHDDLREAKLGAARTVLDSLPDDGRLSLEPETAEQWLTALNDVRLALGTALGVTEDAYETEPADAQMHVYHWLSFLQETLVEALSGDG